jgi:hypothetical protein
MLANAARTDIADLELSPAAEQAAVLRHP